MAHADDVAVAGQHSSGVVEGFSLSDGRALEASGFAHLASEQVKRTAKTYSGASSGLEKHIAEDCALEYPRDFLPQRVGRHGVCHIEYSFYIASFKLVDRQDMSAGKLHRTSWAEKVGAILTMRPAEANRGDQS